MILIIMWIIIQTLILILLYFSKLREYTIYLYMAFEIYYYYYPNYYDSYCKLQAEPTNVITS